MSYPPPPGLKASQPGSVPTSQPHPSLPARPLPPAAPLPSFKPALSANPPTSAGAPGTRHYGSNNGSAHGGGGFGGFTGFKPRSIAGGNQSWPSTASTVSAPPAPPVGFSAPQVTYNGGGYQPSPYQHLQQSFYPTQAPSDLYAQPTPPQIRNPFPLPGQELAGRDRGQGAGNAAYGPELEAQIAQWQSAYASKDDAASGKPSGRGRGEGAASAGGANAVPLGGHRLNIGTPLSSTEINSAVNADTGVAAVVAGADGKQKTVVRSGGGQTWQDPSLLEWDPAHFRLFIGNLAGEVTDESLLKAFSRYASVQKARVVRDKRTTKSKGYGFVSFSNGDDYFNAAKDMQGKYIGSHPVLIKRSTTEIKATTPADKRKNTKHGKGGGRGGSAANTSAGVHKKQSKTKGGLRILG